MGFAKPIEQYLFCNLLTKIHGFMYLKDIIRGKMIMEKMMNTKTEGNTFTKKIGQTVYVVRYHFNEDAKETMQEKINRMLVNEVNRSDFMETEEKMAE